MNNLPFKYVDAKLIICILDDRCSGKVTLCCSPGGMIGCQPPHFLQKLPPLRRLHNCQSVTMRAPYLSFCDNAYGAIMATLTVLDWGG